MKKSVISTLTLLSIATILQISAFAIDPVSSLVQKYKNLYVSKATKQISLNWIQKQDPGNQQNRSFCSTVKTFPTSQGYLTCQTQQYYSLKVPGKNSELFYTMYGSLQYVVLASSQTPPTIYYSYHYPSGALRGIYVLHSQNDRLVYKPDGKLNIYINRNGCYNDNKDNQVVKLRYTQQLCEKYYLQEVGALGYPQAKF